MKPTYDPDAPGHARDPHPQHARLLRQNPLHWSPAAGRFVVTRHADVLAVLRSPAVSVARDEQLRWLESLGPAVPCEMRDLVGAMLRTLLFVDPPHHTALRRAIQHTFRPRRVAALAPLMRGVAEALARGLGGAGRADLVAEFAEPLPVRVVAELLGIPPGLEDDARRGSSAIAALLEPGEIVPSIRAATAAFAGLAQLFRELMKARRRRPGDDLVSSLVAAQARGEIRDERELVGFCILLLVAGIETTSNAIASAFACLLARPVALRAVRADPRLLPLAVEEVLRLESPIQRRSRIAREPLRVGGCSLPAGARIAVLLGAANRDPSVFPDPDRLVLGRRPNPHLAFGTGTHLCLGAHLARLEVRSALATVLAHFPALKAERASIDWKPTTVIRGPASLPVRF